MNLHEPPFITHLNKKTHKRTSVSRPKTTKREIAAVRFSLKYSNYRWNEFWILSSKQSTLKSFVAPIMAGTKTTKRKTQSTIAVAPALQFLLNFGDTSVNVSVLISLPLASNSSSLESRSLLWIPRFLGS